MAYSLHLYHDQLVSGGRANRALPAAHRLLYVRHGAITINGLALEANAATYLGDALTLEAAAEWSQVWRWELTRPNAAVNLLSGEGTLSSLRMSRVITTLDMAAGSQWLFRLDCITSAAGRIADRHQHPGPGIRCLLEGSFNVEQAGQSVRDRKPGDAWWETGSDTVVAWGSDQMPAKFLRAMVLPVEWEGKVTGDWLASGAVAPRGNWQLYVDKIITV